MTHEASDRFARERAAIDADPWFVFVKLRAIADVAKACAALEWYAQQQTQRELERVSNALAAAAVYNEVVRPGMLLAAGMVREVSDAFYLKSGAADALDGGAPK